ncbi:MAG: electron transfer flavoprotein subunit beta [Bdellovibrio sp.]|nr:MAG: electron transfer flavoprotein subunit beta [Bdellovibrio sp.]
MKIFVCVKQVPDTETKVRIAADGLSIDNTAIKWVMNPYDEFAVEEAIKIRDLNAGSQTIVIGLGPKKRVPDSLRTALAMGCDEAILIDAPENLDSLATARCLAKVIGQEGGADLILNGKLAIDDNASAVSQMIAEFLNCAHATVVSKISPSPEGFEIERDSEGGTKEIVMVKKPAVLGANKGLNIPRYASLPGIMKAKKKVIKEIDSASLGVDLSPRTKIASLELPPEKPPVRLISGDVAAQVQELVRSLRDEAKVL